MISGESSPNSNDGDGDSRSFSAIDCRSNYIDKLLVDVSVSSGIFSINGVYSTSGKGDYIMKTGLIGLLVAAVLAFAAGAFADKSLPVYKQGDTVYVCACGESCACKTMSRNTGKCTCGKPLAKGVISSMKGDEAMVKLDGKEIAFTTKAKYVCSCGDACNCDTISQNPGNCTCGKEMRKVE